MWSAVFSGRDILHVNPRDRDAGGAPTNEIVRGKISVSRAMSARDSDSQVDAAVCAVLHCFKSLDTPLKKFLGARMLRRPRDI